MVRHGTRPTFPVVTVNGVSFYPSCISPRERCRKERLCSLKGLRVEQDLIGPGCSLAPTCRQLRSRFRRSLPEGLSSLRPDVAPTSAHPNGSALFRVSAGMD